LGKNKYIETPEKLWEYFTQYLQECIDTPYLERMWVGKDGDQVEKPIMKHISFDGFEGWMALEGIIGDLGDYASNKNEAYSDYSTIITRIRRVCRGQLLTAAISGVANGNVVSRYLGLKESTDNLHTVKDYDVTLDLS
jgi:hypothetical protein